MLLMPSVGKRVFAAALSVGLVAVTVPPVAALQPVQGTIRSAGATWVAADSQDWGALSANRPFVAGDRLRTGDDGHLVADMGDQGAIGLYENAEVSADRNDDSAIIDVRQGKVAFHITEGSPMELAASGASIRGTADSQGFVEVFEGRTMVTTETGSLVVNVGGRDLRVEPGQRIRFDTPIQVAGAYGEPEEPEELPAPPPPPPAPVAPEPVVEVAPPSSKAPLILGLTALAAVLLVVVDEAIDDDDNDDEGSPFQD
jgi:hypothetical protein